MAVMEQYLYHYTSLECFEAILRNDVFLLSSFENANDYKEKICRDFPNKEKILEYNYLSTCAGVNWDGISILSFSNSMMWYFYGNKWEGICIEFKKNRLLSETSPCKHGMITYRDGVSHIDNQNLLNFLMEKRTCWNGENEYRLIYPANKKSIFQISKYINAVYLGPNMTEQNIHSICRELDDKNIQQYNTYFDKIDGRINRILF